jgi:hypothetical protein
VYLAAVAVLIASELIALALKLDQELLGVEHTFTSCPQYTPLASGGV